MIALAISQGGLLGMVGLVEYRNKGILKRLRMTPIKIGYLGFSDMKQPLSNILPLTYFAEGLRESLIYETSIFSGTLWSGIGIMALWGSIAFIIGTLLYNRKSIVAER